MAHVRHQISALPSEERIILHVDTVLRHVGIGSAEDVDLLVDVFKRDQGLDFPRLEMTPSETIKLFRVFMDEKRAMSHKIKSATESREFLSTPSTRPASPGSSTTADSDEESVCVPPRALGGSSIRRLQALRVDRWCGLAP